MKYKVGDRVKLIKSTECTKKFKIDEIYSITQINTDDAYKIQIENGRGIHGYVNEEHVERVFTKSDLKDGDIVTFKNKVKTMKGHNMLINEHSIVSFISDYNEDFTENRCRGCGDIIKVERPTQYETVFEYKEEILNKAEKKYLSDVIRPWRDEVRGIVKEKTSEEAYYIAILMKNDADMNFPKLDNKDDYKGMEVGKLYSLKELEL